ncbi:MAG TPA: hypothetical protein VNV86_12705 [Candidatus Acidoferrum sp.]|nr:hypothetical protein [Candidatus Acidoferrum sp.]
MPGREWVGYRRHRASSLRAGDHWSDPRDGGDAVRLAGDETDPAFSPDGARIAFTGECDGNVDVFVPFGHAAGGGDH